MPRFPKKKPEIAPITRDPESQEELEGFSVFLSYSTRDTDYFKISKISEELEKFPEIGKVYYWEEDSGINIVKYMEEPLKKTQVFVLFCSENSKKSMSVEDEWQAAFQLRKKGLMKIIPVYEIDKYIPNLLTPMLNVRFTPQDFDGFIKNLRKEILREN